MAQAKKYTAEALKRAVGAVNRKELSLRQASVEYGVPVTTIHDNRKPQGTRGRRTDVKAEDETAIVEFCIYMANQGIPVSRTILRHKVAEVVGTYGNIFGALKYSSETLLTQFKY